MDEKGQEKWPKGDEKTWKTAMRDITSGKHFFLIAPFHFICLTGHSTDTPQITKSFVNHVQTSLARAPYNIDDFGAYQAAALSVRDNLIVSYDLLGCLKILSRLLPIPTRDNCRLFFTAHVFISFPPYGILVNLVLLSRSSHYALMTKTMYLRADILQSR